MTCETDAEETGDTDPTFRYLRRALEHAEGDMTRYHIRSALQRQHLERD